MSEVFRVDREFLYYDVFRFVPMTVRMIHWVITNIGETRMVKLSVGRTKQSK